MDIKFRTNGQGFWSNSIREVRITDMKLNSINNKVGFLRVFFDPKTWDVTRDGLIYTDQTFIRDLRRFLKKHKLEGSVLYKQDINTAYVEFWADEQLIKSWKQKFKL